MIHLYVPAPRIGKLQKTSGGFKKLPNGKRAPAVERPAWLNANQRLNHHQKGKYTALWRERAAEAAGDDDVPILGHAKVFCLATVHLPRQVAYDAQNYYPSVKAIIDGIVSDHGMLDDDDNDHMVGPLCVQGGKATDSFGGIQVSFYDLADTYDQSILMMRLGDL